MDGLRRYEEFFSMSLDMLCIASAEGFFVELNPPWEQVLGYSKAELTSRPFLEFVHPDDREATEREAAGLRAGHETVSFVNRYRARSGEYHFLQWSARLSHDRRWFLAVARDVTKAKLAEDALREAQRKAEEASAAKSQFMANMSHELRTPLNAIIGFANLLVSGRAGPLSTPQRDYVQRLRSNGVALLALINDVLDISRIEVGQLEMHLAHVDLGEIVAHALQTFEQTAEERGLRLVWQPPERPVTVLADALRLEQILLNLLGNALKFCERGGVEVALVSRGGRPQRIDVVDTGIGVHGNQIEDMFQAFVQVDGSDSKRHGGTGLGLTISRALARRMGFEVLVDSRKGSGSVFSIVLDPRAEPPRWKAPAWSRS